MINRQRGVIKVTTQTSDPLQALVTHGAFTQLHDKSAYFGRYAMQDLFPSEAVQQLIEQGLAESLGAGEGNGAVFPTRTGLEKALTQSPPGTADEDRILAVLGSRAWDGKGGDRAALVGLFLTQASVKALAGGLAMAHEEKFQVGSVHLETIGGLVPPAIARELDGSVVEASDEIEFARVPDELSPLVELARRYRFVLDVRPKAGAAVVYQWAGPATRLLTTISLRALAAALIETDPGVAATDAFGELDAVLAAFDGEPKLEVLL